MSTLITGANGYVGSYVVQELVDHERLLVLIRARDRAAAIDKLWRGLQLHMDAERFRHALSRIDFVYGDLHAPGLGLSDTDRARILRDGSSILHIAATLNRKSARACLNTNLRGTLSVLELARAMAAGNGLRRFSYCSTVAVAGQREHEVIQEDDAIEWDRSDYDPYGRTKKFCEHMVRELLPDTPLTIFRPSIVLGDARHPRTTSFDMVGAFHWFHRLPVIPMAGTNRVDIVNSDWTGRAIARLHSKDRTNHEIYHLSGGVASPTGRQMRDALGKRFVFAPQLDRGFGRLVRLADRAVRSRSAPKAVRGAKGFTGAIDVFWPYIRYDTVFDNRRAVEELGEAPVSFLEWGPSLLAWAAAHDFRYPHLPTPALGNKAAAK